MNVTLLADRLVLEPETAGDRMLIGTLTIQMSRDKVKHARQDQSLIVWVREGEATEAE